MKVKKDTAMLTPGGISLLFAKGECGSIDAKDSAERGIIYLAIYNYHFELTT